MIDITGDLFKQEADAFVITTNGFVKSNGECVMGKGCALEASNKLPEIKKILGKKIRERGNRTQVIIKREGKKPLVAFPVKPISEQYDREKIVSYMKDKIKGEIPGWACKADMKIIENSAIQLKELADINGWEKVVMPRPGCGAGELKYEDVRKVLEKILDDRFYIITWA